MMSLITISINERTDPLATAMKYIIKNLGLNVRPGDIKFIKKDKTFLVKLNAVVPNEIIPLGRAKKSIVFIFKNVGEMILSENGNINQTSFAHDLEDHIKTEFWKVHQKVEETIKDYGKDVWGRLPPFKWFLRPLYSIINRLIIEQELSKNKLISEDYWKYVIPLIKNNIFNIDPHNEDKLICSNYLKLLCEKYDDPITVSELAVGLVIKNSLDYIMNELNIYGFLSYIDFPKIYYIDALEYGELIEVSYKDLIKKYNRFGRRIGSTFKRDTNFKYMISELVNAKILSENSDKESISGVEELFEKIVVYREEILDNANVIIEGL